MHKNFIITLGLMVAISASAVPVIAETTIYTDGIGRMHFLGKDAANNSAQKSNYTNSAEQDLTRSLYEKSANGISNDTSYDQHPLKNYENTFPDSRFSTSNVWKTKYANNVDDATIQAKSKITATTNKIDGEEVYTKTTEQTVKKHWWQKK